METATTDTYEVNPIPVESNDALAAFRGLQDETRPKMSDAAKAKLRSINEHDRANAEADAHLVTEFNSRPWTLEQLMDEFAKSFGGPQASPRRRAIKAMSRLTQGLRVYRIHDISFLGELLRGEAEMPMYRFLARYPLPEGGIVPKGEPEPPVRRCKSGKKCLRAVRQQGAPAKGSGQYCSSSCAASDKARLKRGSRMMPTIQ